MADQPGDDDSNLSAPEEPKKRQERSGVGQRWCDTLNTPEPRALEDGQLGNLDNPELVNRLTSLARKLRDSTEQNRRRERIRCDLELLNGERIEGLDDSTPVLALPEEGDVNSQIFHCAYSVLSTIKNRIISFRPRAQFLPSGGDGKSRRASRNMTALSDAWADAHNLHAQMSMSYDDKLTTDTSVMLMYMEDGEFHAERFPPWEFMVEAKDGRNMTPECIYHVRDLAVSQVAAQLGVEISELVDSDGFQVQEGTFGSSGSRTEATCRVINAWQVASGKRQGRHVVVVGKRLEVDEDWEYEELPVVLGRWDNRRVGWEGMSAMARLRAAQQELNDQQVTLREAHYNSAVKTISYQENEEAPTGFNNDYVTLMPYKNTAPVVQTPPAVNAEYYTYLQTIKDQMYETLGVSKAAASGESRPGVTAAVAIREDTELQSDRLAEESQEWERQRVEIATWWWRMTRDYARKHPEDKPKWKAISRGAWKELVFDDLEGEYEIRVFPSSLFGQSLPGRFQRADDLIKAGWLEKEDAMGALDVPDISPVVDLFLAPKYLMEKMVDDIMEDEHYETPDPYITAPPYGAKFYAYAQARYFLALVDGGPTKAAMDLMRRLLNALKPQPAPTQPALPPGPPAPPQLGAMQPGQDQAGLPPPPPEQPPAAPPGPPGAPMPVGPPGPMQPDTGLPPIQPAAPVLQ